MRTDDRIEDVLRQSVPQVLGVLDRRYGEFDSCEDAVQEALLDAARQWPNEGVPHNPRGWLIAVAARRLVDQWRSEQARRRREAAAVSLDGAGEPGIPGPDDDSREEDDTLTLLFLCCHPELTPASQIALTLRAVGRLTTAEIAHAFLVPEATMAQRISRAKQRIKATGASFTMPGEAERDTRLRVVLHILYLIFNEGYTATDSADLTRVDLTNEAIRLTRTTHELIPNDVEIAGLLALMLLTDARRSARTRPDGGLIPLGQQDRTRWNAGAMAEGIALISRTLGKGPVGPYQLQAAIAAVHDEAVRSEETDWPQILALYRLLASIEPSPVVTLNQAIAVAMVDGPQAGLDLLAPLDGDHRMATNHRLAAVRGHLLEMTGDDAAARTAYLLAAQRTRSLPERRYLEAQARALKPRDP